MKKTSLKPFNSFGIDAYANDFCVIKNKHDIIDIFKFESRPIVIGDGTNILFVSNIKRPIYKMDIKGFNYHNETRMHIYLTVKAGENWHETVKRTVKSGYSGLENLALIPGTVGAAPVQNIGAYGVELKDRVVSVDVYDIQSKSYRTLTNIECQFQYRDSLFKKCLGQYIIISVTLKLDKIFTPVLDYQNLTSQFNDEDLTLESLMFKIIEIRNKKLPDPKKLANAGSFFKNPIVSRTVLDRVKTDFKDIVYFETKEGQIKLAAGWLIDNLGLKGFRDDLVGIHSAQALVIVNYGSSDGKDILRFSQFIQNRVFEAYGIHLEPEVRFIGEC